MLREEGPRALYKGWLPSVIGVVSYKLAFEICPVILSIFECDDEVLAHFETEDV